MDVKSRSSGCTILFPFLSMLYVVEPALVLNIVCIKYLSMDLTFHSSYVILELMPSTVIFWTELSCCRKSYSNKATLLLGWSHRYKNSTVVIMIWLNITKYPYIKWQDVFLFT